MEEKRDGIKNKYFIEKLPQRLESSIIKIAKKQQFLKYEFIAHKVSRNESGYVGLLYEIDLKGRIRGEDREINIFVKDIPDEIYTHLNVPSMFETEAWVYTKMSKIFTELQDEANIPHKERFKMVYSFDECNPKSIILEHLGKKGFKLYNKMDNISLPYAENCIKELAKFHAFSFVIQEKRPDYFEQKLKDKKVAINFGEAWNEIVKYMASMSINYLAPEVKDAVQEVLLNKAADYPKYMTDSSNVRTLCHGDYKLNNIMIKEVDGEIAEVVPIDFQMVHYGCPILDFIYFIFHGTDQEFRRNHLLYIKDLYYVTLGKFLQKFGINVENYFPRAEFERVYKEKLDVGLMVSIFIAPLLYAIKDDVPDVTTQTLFSLKVDSRFTELFRGVVDDFIQWGYI